MRRCFSVGPPTCRGRRRGTCGGAGGRRRGTGGARGGRKRASGGGGRGLASAGAPAVGCRHKRATQAEIIGCPLSMLQDVVGRLEVPRPERGSEHDAATASHFLLQQLVCVFFTGSFFHWEFFSLGARQPHGPSHALDVFPVRAQVHSAGVQAGVVDTSEAWPPAPGSTPCARRREVHLRGRSRGPLDLEISTLCSRRTPAQLTPRQAKQSTVHPQKNSVVATRTGVPPSLCSRPISARRPLHHAHPVAESAAR